MIVNVYLFLMMPRKSGKTHQKPHVELTTKPGSSGQRRPHSHAPLPQICFQVIFFINIQYNITHLVDIQINIKLSYNHVFISHLSMKWRVTPPPPLTRPLIGVDRDKSPCHSPALAGSDRAVIAIGVQLLGLFMCNL